jgi:hypothetical protein
MEVYVRLHPPVASLPGKEPAVLKGLKAGWAPEPVWTLCRDESFTRVRFRTPAAHPVVRRYTG